MSREAQRPQEFTDSEKGEDTNQRKSTTTSANEKQSRVEEDPRVEPGELANRRVKDGAERNRRIMLVDRSARPRTIELKDPPGLAVTVGGDEWCTKTVLHLPVREEGSAYFSPMKHPPWVEYT